MRNRLNGPDEKAMDWWKILGTTLLLAGGIVFLETQYHTGWIYYLPGVLLGLLALYTSIKQRAKKYALIGTIILMLSVLAFVLFQLDPITSQLRTGLVFLITGVVFLIYLLIYRICTKEVIYWMLLTAGFLLGIAGGFLSRDVEFLDFVVWITVGLSVPMLVWGFQERLFGLLIAGSLLFSSGVGVFIAWSNPSNDINPLVRTGVMLIIFALGWGGIAVLSRRCFEKTTWWALIPAGVLCISGGGLFIGGSADVSREYLGNTISIALIILGIYVLLLRSGFLKKE
mgnify:CR=1 FL=1